MEEKCEKCHIIEVNVAYGNPLQVLNIFSYDSNMDFVCAVKFFCQLRSTEVIGSNQ